MFQTSKGPGAGGRPICFPNLHICTNIITYLYLHCEEAWYFSSIYHYIIKSGTMVRDFGIQCTLQHRLPCLLKFCSRLCYKVRRGERTTELQRFPPPLMFSSQYRGYSEPCDSTAKITQHLALTATSKCTYKSMQFHFGLFYTWTGLLLVVLLVSNMLLTKEGVTSLPICPNGSVNCQLSLGELFERAVKLSHYIHLLSTEIFNEFVSTLPFPESEKI